MNFLNLNELEFVKNLIDNGTISYKNWTWSCELFHQKERTTGTKPNFIINDDRSPNDRIADQTTPLWKLSYQDQLSFKQNLVHKALIKVKKELFSFFPKSWNDADAILPPYNESTDEPLKYIKSLNSSELRAKVQLAWLKKAAKEFQGAPCEILPILPSPTINGYRSKCEFTFGRDLDGEKTCGLLLGLYKEGVHAVLNAKDCLHVSPTAKTIANVLEEYVSQSSHDVYCRIKKQGVYRIVMVRTLLSKENMIMIQINPKDLTELEISNEKVKIKEFLVKRLTDENITLNSLYFQLSDDLFNGFKEGVPALLLHGTCFITESILGQQFQISPLSFFQVNPTATEILYSIIREKTLDAAKKAAIVIDDAVIVTDDAVIVTDDAVIVTDDAVIVTDDVVVTDDDVAFEMANLEKTQETPGVVLLDLCCGTGTIGLTMAAHVKKVIGIELTLEAIEDAKKNAVLNGITNVVYINAKVEDAIDQVFKDHVSPGDIVVAVLDPPRAGVHNSVIKSLRACQSLNHVIFVACALKSSMTNLLGLMRPTSNKVQGFPFVPSKATIVDLFPHTEHVEVVLEFERQKGKDVLPVASSSDGDDLKIDLKIDE